MSSQILTTEQMRGIYTTPQLDTSSIGSILATVGKYNEEMSHNLANFKLYNSLNHNVSFTHSFDVSRLPADFGKSRFDKRITDMSQVSDLTNFRAEQQGALGEIGAAIGNFAVQTASTFANTVGLLPGVVWGMADAIYNRDIRKDMGAGEKVLSFLGSVINNPLSNFINNLAESINESVFTLYKTEEEQNNPWYKNALTHPWTLFSADILPSLGFTAGSMYGGKAIQGINSMIGSGIANSQRLSGAVSKAADAIENSKLPKPLKALASPLGITEEAMIRNRMKQAGIILDGANKAELNQLFNKIKQDKSLSSTLINDLEKRILSRNRKSLFTGLVTGAVGEAQIEGLNAAKELRESEIANLDAAWQSPEMNTHLSNQYKHYLEEAEKSNESQILSFEDFKQQKYDQKVQEIEQAANKAAVWTTVAESALLSATNASAWKSFFHPTLNPKQAAKDEMSKLFHYTTKKSEKSGANVLESVWADEWKRGTGFKLGAKKAFMEGPVEEMGQAWISEAAKSYYGSGLFGEYKDLVESDYNKEAIGFLDAVSKGFAKSYLDADRWIEGVSGSLFGVIGVPDIGIRSKSHRGKTKRGHTKLFGKDGMFQVNAWDNAYTEAKNMHNTYNAAAEFSKKFQTPEEGLSEAQIMKKVAEHIITKKFKTESPDDQDGKDNNKDESALSDKDINYLAYGDNPLELLRNIAMLHELSKKTDWNTDIRLNQSQDMLLQFAQLLQDIYSTIGCDDLFQGFWKYLKEADNVDLSDKNNETTKFFTGVFDDEIFTKIPNFESNTGITKNLSDSEKYEYLKGIASNAKTVGNYLSKYSKLRESFRETLLFRFPKMTELEQISSYLASFMARAEMEDEKIDYDSLNDFRESIKSNEKISKAYSKLVDNHKRHLKAINRTRTTTSEMETWNKLLESVEDFTELLQDETYEDGTPVYSEDEIQKIISDSFREIKVDTMKGEILAALNTDRVEDIYKYFYDIEDEILSEKERASLEAIHNKINKFINDNQKLTEWDKIQGLLPLIDELFEIGGMDELYKTRKSLWDNNNQIKDVKNYALNTALSDFILLTKFRRALKSAKNNKVSDKEPARREAIQFLLNKLLNTGIDNYQQFLNETYQLYANLNDQKEAGVILSPKDAALLDILSDVYKTSYIAKVISILTEKYANTDFLNDFIAAATSTGQVKFIRTFDYKQYYNEETNVASGENTNTIWTRVAGTKMPGSEFSTESNNSLYNTPNNSLYNTSNNQSSKQQGNIIDRIKERLESEEGKEIDGVNKFDIKIDGDDNIIIFTTEEVVTGIITDIPYVTIDVNSKKIRTLLGDNIEIDIDNLESFDFDEKFSNQKDDRLFEPIKKIINIIRKSSSKESTPLSTDKSSLEFINIWSSEGEYRDLSNFAERPFSLSRAVTRGYGIIVLQGQEDPTWDRIRDILNHSNLVGVNKENPIEVKTVENLFQALKVLYASEDYFEKVGEDEEFKLSKEGKELFLKILNASPAQAKQWGGRNGIIKELSSEWDNVSSEIMKNIIKTSFIQNPEALQRLLSTGNATLTHTQDNSKWKTEFPKLLMEVREELANDHPDKTPKAKVVNQAVSSPNKTRIESINKGKTVYKLESYINDLLDQYNTQNSTPEDAATLLRELRDAISKHYKDAVFADSIRDLSSLGIVYNNSSKKYEYKFPDKVTCFDLARMPFVFDVGDEVEFSYNNDDFRVKVTEINANGKIIAADPMDGTTGRYRSGWFEVGSEIKRASESRANKNIMLGSFPLTLYDYAYNSKDGTLIQYRSPSTESLKKSDKYNRSVAVSEDIRYLLQEPYSNNSTSCAYSAAVDGYVKPDSKLQFKVVKAKSQKVNTGEINKFYNEQYSFAADNCYLGIYCGDKLVGIVDPSNTELLTKFSAEYAKASQDKKSSVVLDGKVDEISSMRSHVLLSPDTKHPINDFKSDDILYLYKDAKGQLTILQNGTVSDITPEKLNRLFLDKLKDESIVPGKIYGFVRTTRPGENNKMIYGYAPIPSQIIQAGVNELLDKSKDQSSLFFMKYIDSIVEDINRIDSQQSASNVFVDFLTYFYTDKGQIKVWYNKDNEGITINLEDKDNNDILDTNGKSIAVTISKNDDNDQIKNKILDFLKQVDPLISFKENPFHTPVDSGKSYFDHMKELGGLTTFLPLSYEHNVYFTYNDGIKHTKKSVTIKSEKSKSDGGSKTTEYAVGYGHEDGKPYTYWNVEGFDPETTKNLDQIKKDIKKSFKEEWFNAAGIMKFQDTNGKHYIKIIIINNKDTSKKTPLFIDKEGNFYNGKEQPIQIKNSVTKKEVRKESSNTSPESSGSGNKILFGSSTKDTNNVINDVNNVNVVSEDTDTDEIEEFHQNLLKLINEKVIDCTAALNLIMDAEKVSLMEATKILTDLVASVQGISLENLNQDDLQRSLSRPNANLQGEVKDETKKEDKEQSKGFTQQDVENFITDTFNTEGINANKLAEQFCNVKKGVKFNSCRHSLQRGQEQVQITKEQFNKLTEKFWTTNETKDCIEQ